MSPSLKRVVDDMVLALDAEPKVKWTGSVWFGPPSSSQGGSYIWNGSVQASTEEEAKSKCKREALNAKPYLKGRGKFVPTVTRVG